MNRRTLNDLLRHRQPSAGGAGPLLQRDYWAIIRDCRLRPSEVMRLVARRFPEFSPAEYAAFESADGSDEELRVGDELSVRIRMAGTSRVRVLHRDRTSLTIGTLEGHPEAGRITFGAYRNDYGHVIFHIRSRARSRSERDAIGFQILGDPMQTNTWTDFVNRVAATVGAGVVGVIHTEKRRVRERPGDADSPVSPTFIARAD